MEFGFVDSYSTSGFEDFTPASGVTPYKKKLIDCSS